MAPKSYAELKKQVADMKKAEDALKAEIARLTAEPGAAGSDAAAVALAAKEKAEGDAVELQNQIDELSAEIARLTADAPKSVKLERPYAFFAEDGALISWPAGEVFDADDIEILRERGVI